MCFLTLLKTYLYERQIDEVERVAERQIFHPLVLPRKKSKGEENVMQNGGGSQPVQSPGVQDTQGLCIRSSSWPVAQAQSQQA